MEDLKAFDASLSAANQFPIKGANGLPATVRWEPELDDGVLLNAAPSTRTRAGMEDCR